MLTYYLTGTSTERSLRCIAITIALNLRDGIMERMHIIPGCYSA